MQTLSPAHSVRVSEDAVAEERVDSGEGFHRVECGGAGGDAVRRERGLRGGRDGFLRERVWQDFEGGIVVERKVDAFVGFDEDEDTARTRCSGAVIRCC